MSYGRKPSAHEAARIARDAGSVSDARVRIDGTWRGSRFAMVIDVSRQSCITSPLK
jgi:hypothetical protein